MAKEKIKTKSGTESRLELLRRVGDYKAIRAMNGSGVALEPNPLVFWIGIGSVALAKGLTLWLLL